MRKPSGRHVAICLTLLAACTLGIALLMRAQTPALRLPVAARPPSKPAFAPPIRTVVDNTPEPAQTLASIPTQPQGPEHPGIPTPARIEAAAPPAAPSDRNQAVQTSDSADSEFRNTNLTFLIASTTQHSTQSQLLLLQSTLFVDRVRRCPADFNHDGELDLSDYLDFMTALSRGDPSADLTGDGTIDLFDYLDFVNAYSAGC
jgi:hypothetical protein